MTLGEYFIQLLEVYGVDHVFGIPGVHTVELYRGLASSRIRHVLPRHEQGAGFMADGYARVTGKPGVSFVITGPGLANIITPMGQAYADSIPMLVVSAVNRRTDLGHAHGLLHEVPDQQKMVESVCAFSHRVQSVEELPGVLARAFSVFSGSRPRPVHLEIPIDVMTLPVDHAAHTVRNSVIPAEVSAPIADDILERVLAARNPFVLIGGGCRSVSPEIVGAAVSALGAPAILTVNGRDCLSVEHPLAVPASPSLNAAREAMLASDLIVALGTEFGRTDYDMFGAGMVCPTAPIIRVDIDSQQLAGSQFPGREGADDMLIAADVGSLLRHLSLKDSQPGAASRAAAIRAAACAELSPDMAAGVAFLEVLRESVHDAIIVGDSTQPVYAGNLYYGVRQPGRWFNSSVGFGTLGYALPSAIGARLGRPSQPVIALIGDGGIQFTIAELGAIPDDRSIIVLVWNNNGYGEIKSSMKAAQVVPVGVDFSPPIFEHIAKAYGLDFMAPTDLNSLAQGLRAAAANPRSTLIEVSESMVYQHFGLAS